MPWREEMKTKDIVQFKISQFEQFYDLLMKEAPGDYVPWFFPCEKNNKIPSPQAILKINPNSKGSWHNESARLSKKQCIELIKEGYNIGISARDGDPLIIIDIDEQEYLSQIPENTLTVMSRKRAGFHAFCWDKDGSAKKNIPTDFGEMRSVNQYVLACGSYVPFDLKNEKDKKAFDKLPDKVKKDTEIGYYTIYNKVSPRSITFDECPRLFQDKEQENLAEESNILQKEEKRSYEDKGGKYSDLFKLKVSDIVGFAPANKRMGHPLHESDTDANWSLSKDGCIGHCWRHMVSLNAVQYLCVKAGYRNCEDAGTPHKGRGISKIRGDKKAYKIAYDEAVKMEVIRPYQGGEGKTTNNEFLFSKGINSKTGREEFGVKIDKVADHLISIHGFKTWFGEKTDCSFYWNGKIMQKGTRGIVKVESEKLLNRYCKRNVVDEIFEKIKRKTEIDKEEFEMIDTNFINVENGIWDIENKKLLPHDQKYNFQYLIPINKNEDPLEKQDCPNWLKFIEETLYPEDIPVMQEWFGFNLYREYFIKKAVICEGEQDTGKSVLLDTVIKFIGEKNKTGLSLQKITCGSDFTKLSLKNKHSNVFDDLSSNDLNDGGAFKVATGGGYISGEEKFGEYQQFRSFAKQMFATNKIPPVKDNDDLAYFGRWIILKFDNEPEEIDPFLRKKLWTDKEMSGILNWALEGLYRILENGKFSYNKTPEEVKQLMEISGCPLVAFSAEVLEREDGTTISKDDMFKIYSVWCNANNRPRLSKEKLGRDLTKYCNFIIPEKHKERIWKNAKISKIFLEKNNLHVTTDTSDTFQKLIYLFSEEGIIRHNIGINKGVNLGDIKLEKVSEAPPKDDIPTDTYDTFSQKDKAVKT